MSIEFKYLVVDYEGEPLRKFESLHSARWFSRNKEGCKIIKLNFKTDKEILQEMFKQVGEAPF